MKIISSRLFSRASFILFLLCLSKLCYGADPVYAVAGSIDARSWNFETKRLPLNGDWKFFPQRLLSLQECLQEKGTLTTVPKVWNEMNPDGNGIGYGTYYLKILVPSGTENLALFIPQLYNSYALSINGIPVAANGKVGATKEESIPQWLPQLVPFKIPADTLHFVLQISNFHHHKGGIREPLYLGTKGTMSGHYNFAIGSNLMQMVLLSLEGLILLFFYFQDRSKPVMLYFSLMCITWGIRVIFSNLYPFITFFPDFPWTAMLRIEYLTLYLTVIWSTLFVNLLFHDVSSTLFKYVIVTVSICFILFTLFSPPIFFTKWLSLYIITAGITLMYGIIVIIRALVYEKAGVWSLVLSVFLIIFLMGYDIIAYEGFMSGNVGVTSIGYVLIFALITIGLLRHLDVIKGKSSGEATLTYTDLYRNDSDRTR